MNEANYISGSEANDMDNENDGWSLGSIEPIPQQVVEVINIPNQIQNQHVRPNHLHFLRDDDSVSHSAVSHNGVNDDEQRVGYDEMLSVFWELAAPGDMAAAYDVERLWRSNPEEWLRQHNAANDAEAAADPDVEERDANGGGGGAANVHRGVQGEHEDIVMWDGTNPNHIRQASDNFASNQGLRPIRSLDEIGRKIDVPPNGNCYWSAVAVGLYYLGVEPFCLQDLNEEDRTSNFRSILSNMTAMRREMFIFFEQNILQFHSPDNEIRRVHNSCGNLLADFQANPLQLLYNERGPGGTLFRPDVNFDNGCARHLWGDVNYHVPIVALQQQVTIVVYSIVGTTPNTLIAHYDRKSGNVVVHTFQRWVSPTWDSPTICLALFGGHFQYIKLRFFDQLHSSDSESDTESVIESLCCNYSGLAKTKPSHPSPPSSNVFKLPPTSVTSSKGTFASANKSSKIASPPSQVNLELATQLLGKKQPIDSYPWYKEETTSGSKAFINFIPFDEATRKFSVSIPAAELAGKVIVELATNGAIDSVQFGPEFKERANFFHNHIEKNDDFPKFVVLRSVQSGCTKPKTGGRGKRATHDYVVWWKGVCSEGRYRTADKKDTHPRCTTTYVGGITEKDLKEFARRPNSSSVTVSIELSGACIHEKGKLVGQLRGQSRREAVQEIKHTKKHAKEFAKHKLAQVAGVKYLNNNIVGVVNSPKKVYNLSREARAQENAAKGIMPGTPCDDRNIMRAIELTREQDLDDRKLANDDCTVMPGVARRVDLCPKINVYLHTRAFLFLAGQLSSFRRLVMGVDSTGQMLNFPNSPHDGKVQHTFLTIQGTECLLSRSDAVLAGKKLLSPAIIDTIIATESVFGRGNGQALVPTVIKMDCALELMQGAIAAFRSEELQHVVNAQQYNDAVMLVLLRLESKVDGVSDEQELRRHAIASLAILLQVSPCVFKQCKTHVYKAMSQYPKMHVNHPAASRMKTWTNQFQQVFETLAHQLQDVPSISEAIVRLSIVVAILSTKSLPCGIYNEKSEVQEHHHSWMSESIAVNMDAAMRRHAESLVINEDDTFESAMKNVFNTSNDAFNGQSFARPIIDSIQNVEKLQFSIAYLKNVKKAASPRGVAHGEVGICIVHSPHGEDEMGRRIVTPRKVGGFVVKVSLPHTAGKIDNPLYCPMAARYLINTWISRIGLWCQPVINLVDTAMDARVFPCNNSLEGTISYEKNGSSTFQVDVSSVANLIHKRSQDLREVGRLLANEIDSAGLVVERRKRRLEQNSGTDAFGAEGVESEMLWKKTPGTIRANLLFQKERTVAALSRGKERGLIHYNDDVLKSKHDVLVTFGNTMDASFMSISVFRQWFNGERTNPLQSTWNEILNNFYICMMGNGKVAVKSGNDQSPSA